MKTYILIMLFATNASSGGVATLQQEFTSLENCQTARKLIVKAKRFNSDVTIFHGCFPK